MIALVELIAILRTRNLANKALCSRKQTLCGSQERKMMNIDRIAVELSCICMSVCQQLATHVMSVDVR